MLDGLLLLLEAGGLEDLFSGPDDEAAFLYDLLRETARGRASAHYWETCRTARRRGVTPEYVIDRAAVLLTSIEERRRADLYRLLGAPPLSSPETLRQRYLDLAKTAHPDVGGDPERFRHVKEAYEILRDPERRAEYERFWVRALGPFERVVPDEMDELATTVVTTRPLVPRVPPEDAPVESPMDREAESSGRAEQPAPEDELLTERTLAAASESPSSDDVPSTTFAPSPVEEVPLPLRVDDVQPSATGSFPNDDMGLAASASLPPDDVQPSASEPFPNGDVPPAVAPPRPERDDIRPRRVVMVGRAAGTRDWSRPQDGVAAAAAEVLAMRAELDRRIGPVAGGVGGVTALLAQIQGALATVTGDDITQARAEIARSIADLEQVRERLDLIAHLQRQVAKLVTG